jgi:hypothetical protein
MATNCDGPSICSAKRRSPYFSADAVGANVATPVKKRRPNENDEDGDVQQTATFDSAVGLPQKTRKISEEALRQVRKHPDLVWSQEPPPPEGPASLDNPNYVWFSRAWDEPVTEAFYQAALWSKQKSEDWLKKYRKLKKFDLTVGTFSGSFVAHANGTGYECKKKSLQVCQRRAASLLVNGRPFFTNAAIRWGNGAESWAETAFENYTKTFIGQPFYDPSVTRDMVVDARRQDYGSIVHKTCPRRRYSPDGVLVWTLRRDDGSTYEIRELIEFKCPFKLRFRRDGFREEDGYADGPIQRSENVSLPITSYYYPQCQWGMYLLKKMKLITHRRCHFVVWWPGYWDRQVDDDAGAAQQHDLWTDGLCATSGTSDDRPPFDEEKMEHMRRRNYYQWPYHEVRTTCNGKSTTVMGPTGSFQWTMIPFDAAYTSDLIRCTEVVWKKYALPALWEKYKTACKAKACLACFADTGDLSRLPERKRERLRYMQSKKQLPSNIARLLM